MVEEEPFQEYSNPWKLWIPEEINRHWQEDDSPCKRGIIRRNWIRAKVEQGIRRAGMCQEVKMGRKDLGSRWPRFLLKDKNQMISEDGAHNSHHVEYGGTLCKT
jgi:hypothetical protein